MAIYYGEEITPVPGGNLGNPGGGVTPYGGQGFRRRFAINPQTGEKVYEGSPGFEGIYKQAQAIENSQVQGGLQGAGNEFTNPYSPYFIPPGTESAISRDSRDLTASYLRDFPAILEAIRRQTPLFERQELSLAQELSPQYAAVQRELFRRNQAAEAGSQLAQLQRVGGPIAEQYLKQDQILNPEFYSSRARTAEQLNQLLSGGLSGSELSSIERGNNRQFENAGTGGLPIRSKEIESAINYGQAGRDRLTQALQIATQAIPALRSPVQGYRPSSATDIAGAFQNVKSDIGESTRDLARFNPAESATQLKIADITKPRKNDSFNLGLSL